MLLPVRQHVHLNLFGLSHADQSVIYEQFPELFLFHLGQYAARPASASRKNWYRRMKLKEECSSFIHHHLR